MCPTLGNWTDILLLHPRAEFRIYDSRRERRKESSQVHKEGRVMDEEGNLDSIARLCLHTEQVNT